METIEHVEVLQISDKKLTL